MFQLWAVGQGKTVTNGTLLSGLIDHKWKRACGELAAMQCTLLRGVHLTPELPLEPADSYSSGP
jgi:hypothetical protein